LKAGEEASRLDLKCRANLFRLPPCREVTPLGPTNTRRLFTG